MGSFDDLWPSASETKTQVTTSLQLEPGYQIPMRSQLPASTSPIKNKPDSTENRSQGKEKTSRPQARSKRKAGVLNSTLTHCKAEALTQESQDAERNKLQKPKLKSVGIKQKKIVPSPKKSKHSTSKNGGHRAFQPQSQEGSHVDDYEEATTYLRGRAEVKTHVEKLMRGAPPRRRIPNVKQRHAQAMEEEVSSLEKEAARIKKLRL